MNNGEPQSKEVKRKILNDLKREGKGSENANKTFVNWNLGKETEITIQAMEVSESHKQYEFLSGESSQKLMTGHRVVSPILFGIKDSSGLGNNADEMESAFNELMIMVIQPMQEDILDALMEIFTDNGMTIDLDFIPIRNTAKGEPTKLSSQEVKEEVPEMDVILANDLIELGEVIDTEEWEEIDEERYSEEMVSLSATSLHLATVPSNLPLAPSSIDNEYFKVRFQYAGSLNPEREFCQRMIGAGRTFRLEDIKAASKSSVNPGLGPKGTNKYDILKYKGGANCKHYWLRKVYLKKGNNYITVKDAKKLISDLKKIGVNTEIPQSGEELSTKKPHDMPNRGYLTAR